MGGGAYRGEPHRDVSGSSKAEGVREDMVMILLQFLREEMEKAEEDLELASLNNFHKLWVIGAVPCCLVSGPEVIRQGEQWP